VQYHELPVEEASVNENLRRAVDALQAGASDLADVSARSAWNVRERLAQTVNEVLDHLEAEEADPEPEDIMSSLDRQSRDIAEDLRRADRLMKQRLGRE
jgi:hypothetical protein